MYLVKQKLNLPNENLLKKIVPLGQNGRMEKNHTLYLTQFSFFVVYMSNFFSAIIAETSHHSGT